VAGEVLVVAAPARQSRADGGQGVSGTPDRVTEMGPEVDSEHP
jgi:hypothetical protein